MKLLETRIKRNKSPTLFHQVSVLPDCSVVWKLIVRGMILGIFLWYLGSMSTALDEKPYGFSLLDGFQRLAALKLVALYFFSPLPVFRLGNVFTTCIDKGLMQSDFFSGEKNTREI